MPGVIHYLSLHFFRDRVCAINGVWLDVRKAGPEDASGRQESTEDFNEGRSGGLLYLWYEYKDLELENA